MIERLMKPTEERCFALVVVAIQYNLSPVFFSAHHIIVLAAVHQFIFIREPDFVPQFIFGKR